MTATVISTEPTTEGPTRTLSITVNLLPPEIAESRRVRRVRRVVLSALAVVVALLAGWYGLASYQTVQARRGLDSAESDVQRLQRQQNAFADLIGVQRESQTIRTQLSALLASDLRWSGILTAVQNAAPAGVRLTNVAGALTPAAGSGGATGGGPAGAQLPNTTGRRLVGSLTVTGTAGNKAMVAEYVDRLGKVPGLGNPFLASSMPEDTAERFTVRLDITDATLGGHYPSGGK
jgi:hypothetical protein